MAGVLSALGMGLADQIAMREATLESVLSPASVAEARRLVGRLALDGDAGARGSGRARGTRAPQGPAHDALSRHGHRMPCELPAGDDVAAVRAEFEAAYRRRFAFLMRSHDFVIESVTVECIGAGEGAQASLGAPGSPDGAPSAPKFPRPAAAAPATVSIYCLADDEPAGWRRGRLLDGEALPAGTAIDGPAIIAQRNATIVVEPGWRARTTELGNLELGRIHARPAARAAAGMQADPVMLEVFNNLFMNVAEQMGLSLQNTAHSVNIKERLDFSCAVFDAQGNLIANAPHMPVHLGSMSESIRTVIAANPRLAPGEAYVLNDPYRGGTHLPDITVITPVFLDIGLGAAAAGDREARAPSFFVASRGHHADVGGTTPGSMPPFSASIEEEGVLIDNLKLLEAGRLHEKELLDLLSSGAYPARNPAQNLADLRAQIAANEKGVRGAARHGRAVRTGNGRALHAARAGQRRGMRAPGDHGLERRGVHTHAR